MFPKLRVEHRSPSPDDSGNIEQKKTVEELNIELLKKIKDFYPTNEDFASTIKTFAKVPETNRYRYTNEYDHSKDGTLFDGIRGILHIRESDINELTSTASLRKSLKDNEEYKNVLAKMIERWNVNGDLVEEVLLAEPFQLEELRNLFRKTPSDVNVTELLGLELSKLSEEKVYDIVEAENKLQQVKDFYQKVNDVYEGNKRAVNEEGFLDLQ